MSEYITIEAEYSDDPDEVRLITNLRLAQGEPESYASREQGDLGSPLAQTLFGIDGLQAVQIESGTLTVRRAAGTEWHTLIDEISIALKDFFL